MNGYKVIVFDYDGTLFDTRPAIAFCIQRAFAEMGRPIPLTDAIAKTVRIGLPLQETFLVLDRSVSTDRAALTELVRTYRAIYLDQGPPLSRPFEGVSIALERLHATGIKCLIVSNKGVEAIRRSLDDSRLSRFVELVFGDEPSLPKKPDPAILTDHILPRYADVEKGRILIVGDTETDILFARAAEISCCWASYGYGEMARCRSLAPEHEISSFKEVLALVH